ncbi:MAG: hypothetical protein KatS3mg100_065 [Candidatus Parcubacteria bacterium]|nr:MAG: hypothetical protein KatS3mg100_065 [Candidatus Parcubacteria bacterium]
MFNLTRLQRFALMGLVAGMATGISLFALRGVLLGPRIEIYGPQQATVEADSPLRVFGKATQATTLSVNGAPVALDVQGFFDYVYDPAPGINYLTLEARDRLGRTARRVLTLVARPKEAYTTAYEQDFQNESAQKTSQASTTENSPQRLPADSR